MLSYAIRGESAPAWDSAWVTDDGTTYTVTIPAATTAGIVAGAYRLVGFVTLAGARYTVYDAALTVTPDTAAQVAGDAQAHAERMVAILEAEIEARITGTGSGHETYQIGDRMLQRIPIAEVYQLLNKYRAELKRLRNPGGLGTTVKARFTQSASFAPANWFNGLP